MASNDDEIKRDKLCECKTCELAYTVVDFMESLVTNKEISEVEENYVKSKDEERKAHFVLELKTYILANAFVEFMFRNGGDPQVIPVIVAQAWNNRAMRCIEIETGVRQKPRSDGPEGYES